LNYRLFKVGVAWRAVGVAQGCACPVAVAPPRFCAKNDNKKNLALIITVLIGFILII